MKELQAFYKIRTKILHSKISELNHLVDNQNGDIRGTRDKYTDELLTLKDEVFDLRNMAGQLEIMQQSADFYMHGAYITNQNFGNEYESNSFERNIVTRGSEATKSLYDKAKTIAMHQKNKLSNHSKTGSTHKTLVT